MAKRSKMTGMFSMAPIRKCVYPHPVYEAHFADNTVSRLSFWSPANKPLDSDHGRRLVAAIWPGKALTDGFVEHDPTNMEQPWHRSRDPFFSGEAVVANKRPRAPTAKQCLTVIARLVDGDESAINEARALLDKAA